MLTVDGRCHCGKCKARTENIYRMVGTCGNCGATPILILYRAGDKAAPVDCPTCEMPHGVGPNRLAIVDEIPDDTEKDSDHGA